MVSCFIQIWSILSLTKCQDKRGRVFGVANRPKQQAVAEWPTVLVIIGVYGAFAAITLSHRSVSAPVTIVGLAFVTAWQGSLQHELLHGHGLRSRLLREFFARQALTIWLPFADYRNSHLRHHDDQYLTDPFDDPESTYRSGPEWQALPRPLRGILWVNRTLVGRVTVGPAIAMVRFFRTQLDLLRNTATSRRIWAEHLVAVGAVLAWVVGVAHLPLWEFLLGSAYFGTSLTMVRSFAEHTWRPDVVERTAVVRSRGFWSLLFLNNNLHVTHHLRPDVPWFRLPALTDSLHADEIAADGAGRFRGYRDVAWQFAFRPRCQPAFPADVGHLPLPRVRRIRQTA